MTFELGNVSDKLVFSDFELTSSIEAFKRQGPPIFISTRITAHLPQFYSQVDTCLTHDDLKRLRTDLKRLWNRDVDKFEFENVDWNIKLTLTMDQAGHVFITGNMFNSDKSADLNFDIETDQSYLTSTMGQLSEIINVVEQKMVEE